MKISLKEPCTQVTGHLGSDSREQIHSAMARPQIAPRGNFIPRSREVLAFIEL